MSQVAGPLAASTSLSILLHGALFTASVSPLVSSASDVKQQEKMLQRREGVATVGFLLHPNGTIENTRLVSSSSTKILDRAALTAVKRIESFRLAQHYLERAEEFKVDVVFTLLC